MSDTLWVEKYRPESLEEIVGHDAVVRRMQDFVDDSEMPNILFAGRQGIGKTAIVQSFAKERYGSDWRQLLLTLNASDERGIETVRKRIKDFARTGSGKYDFKVIFLDEADQLTGDAQPALRRTMEDYSDTTRFILSCNYPGQIIDPIQSRCAIYRLSALSDEQVMGVLSRVVEQESLKATEPALERVVREARGDARQAVNTLQACVVDGELTEEDAEDILGVVDYELVEDIVDQALAGEFEEAFETLDNEILKEGVPVDTTLEMFLSVIKNRGLSEDAVVKSLDALGDADHRLREGANPNVQMHALLSKLLIAKHSGVYGDE